MNKIKKEVIKRLKNTYCKLKPSKIEGVGVFAVRDIPKNVNPFLGVKNQRWYEFKLSELKSLDKEILKMIDSFFVIEKDKTVYIPRLGFAAIDISFYVNNSKNPNIKTVDNGLTFVTLRRIKKGEEIVVSYATYDDKYK